MKNAEPREVMSRGNFQNEVEEEGRKPKYRRDPEIGFFRNQGKNGCPDPSYETYSATAINPNDGENNPGSRENGSQSIGQLSKEVDSQYCGMLVCNIEGLKTYRNKQKIDILKEKAIEENLIVVSIVEIHLNASVSVQRLKWKAFKSFGRIDKKERRSSYLA